MWIFCNADDPDTLRYRVNVDWADFRGFFCYTEFVVFCLLFFVCCLVFGVPTCGRAPIRASSGLVPRMGGINSTYSFQFAFGS
jgi:hypothetical protein